MRLFMLAAMCLALLAPQAQAQEIEWTTLQCRLPTANVAEARDELCEQLRRKRGVRSAEWTIPVCASEFLYMGLLQGRQTLSKRNADLAVAGQVSSEVADFKSTWPRPTRAVCGDGILDDEVPFFESCDDGNTENGDGCSNSCGIE